MESIEHNVLEQNPCEHCVWRTRYLNTTDFYCRAFKDPTFVIILGCRRTRNYFKCKGRLYEKKVY